MSLHRRHSKPKWKNQEVPTPRSDSTRSCRLANLFTVDSMPLQPRLYNIDRRLGPVIKFYVLGYPLTSSGLIMLADSNQIAPEKTRNNRRHLTWRAICRKPRWAVVTIEAGSITNCVIVATNDSLEDMKRSDALETIRTVQKGS